MSGHWQRMQSPPSPNVLLLVTDQFRFDAFSPEITPNLYRLSEKDGATTFRRAYSSTPTCTPARAALLTGKSPWSHGMLSYATYVDCDKYPTTLPSVLRDFGGYRTVSVGKNHFGPKKHIQGYEEETNYEGLHAIFDDYDRWFNTTSSNMDPLATCDLDWNDWAACPYAYQEFQHPTAWTTRQALRVLDSHFQPSDEDRDPLFLKVSYHRPHSPYDPPARLLQNYLEKGSKAMLPQLDRIVNGSTWDAKYKGVPMKPDTWAGDPGADLARYSRAGYLASVEYVDENIGYIWQYLTDQNLWDEFLIVWVADHGDMNGDHFLWRKGFPWEGSSHIPMVTRIPNAHNTPPKTSNALVELRDVAPTIYDYLGMLHRVTQVDPLLDGKSVLPILQGQASSVRHWLDLEHGTVYRQDIHWNALVGYFHTESCDFWKFVFNAFDGTEELYCLANDPHESDDLAQSTKFATVLNVWRGRLTEQFEDEGRGGQWVWKGHLQKRETSTLFGLHYPCLQIQDQ